MPSWSTSLPAAERHMAFDLVRTPADQPLSAIVTAADFVGCDTHYWGGRTVPCERPDCPACNAGMPFRWHAYLSCVLVKSKEHSIFECTAAAAAAFSTYKQIHGTLRGCLFQASRPKKDKNSKVVIVTRPANLAGILLPEPPDLIVILSIIWNLPTKGVAVEHDFAGQKKMTHRKTNFRPMREPMNAASDPILLREAIARGNGK